MKNILTSEFDYSPFTSASSKFAVNSSVTLRKIFQLHSFYAKLEGHFPPNLLQDMTDFLCVLDEDQRSSDEQPEEGERLSDGQPGMGWSEDILRVHGERARATTVAALLGAALRRIPIVRNRTIQVQL